VVVIGGRLLGLRKRGEIKGYKVDGDDEALIVRHVCITMSLTLVTSLLVNVVHANLT